MTAIQTIPQEEDQVFPWWLVLLEGIALIIIGLLFISSPKMTEVIAVQMLGLYWIFAGVLSLVRMFIDSYHWGWKLLGGILGIIAGILVIQHPLWSTAIVGSTLIIILGFLGLVIGISNLVQAFRGAGWGAAILGILSIIFGLVLLANVWVFSFSLPYTLGFLALIGGIVAIFGAFRVRSEQKAAAVQPVAPAMMAKAEPVAEEKIEAEAKAEPVVKAMAAAEMVEAEGEVEVEEPVAEMVEAAAEAEVGEAMIEVVEPESKGEEVSEVAAVEAAEEVAEIPDSPGEKAKFHHNLAFVEGIGPAYAAKLKEIGLTTPMDLLERGADPKGRSEIAEQTGISGKLILTWVNQADLFRISGIGPQYADLLEEAGVDTVPSLAQRNPENLHSKLIEVNEDKKLVREVPGLHQVESWVSQAKELPRKLTY